MSDGFLPLDGGGEVGVKGSCPADLWRGTALADSIGFDEIRQQGNSICKIIIEHLTALQKSGKHPFLSFRRKPGTGVTTSDEAVIFDLRKGPSKS